MSKSLLFQPTPPPINGARLVLGLAGHDDQKPNPANEARAKATKRLTATEEAALAQAYRAHVEAATIALREFRLGQTKAREALLRKHALAHGVSLSAVERAVGLR
jgi:hypothetical protein